MTFTNANLLGLIFSMSFLSLTTGCDKEVSVEDTATEHGGRRTTAETDEETDETTDDDSSSDSGSDSGSVDDSATDDEPAEFMALYGKEPGGLAGDLPGLPIGRCPRLAQTWESGGQPGWIGGIPACDAEGDWLMKCVSTDAGWEPVIEVRLRDCDAR